VRDTDAGDETEGVFLYRDGSVVFRPLTVGIAGERYFEVLGDLDEGDTIVTGPYAVVRELEDGDPVAIEEDDEG
jgi:HlyD family secretion protein